MEWLIGGLQSLRPPKFWLRSCLYGAQIVYPCPFSGTNDQPAFLGGRVLTLFWWLFCVVIISSYTANMAAILSARLANQKPPTLDEVLKDPNREFFVENQSALHKVWMMRMRRMMIICTTLAYNKLF